MKTVNTMKAMSNMGNNSKKGDEVMTLSSVVARALEEMDNIYLAGGEVDASETTDFNHKVHPMIGAAEIADGGARRPEVDWGIFTGSHWSTADFLKAHSLDGGLLYGWAYTGKSTRLYFVKNCRVAGCPDSLQDFMRKHLAAGLSEEQAVKFLFNRGLWKKYLTAVRVSSVDDITLACKGMSSETVVMQTAYHGLEAFIWEVRAGTMVETFYDGK